MRSTGSHWLSVGMPDQQRQVATLLEIEREAKQLTTVSPLLIPGLLQTAEYARSIMNLAGVPADEIDTRVAVRVGRRDVIAGRNPAQFRAYVGEAALRTIIGGPAAMSYQLEQLVQLGQWDNVELQVVPLRADWHPGLEGLFSIASFGDGRDPVVHLENRISGLFLHETAEVSAYEEALGRMDEVALSPAESTKFIVGIIEETEATV